MNYGSAISALLQRHDGALLLRKRLRRLEEFNHVAFALLQYVAQIRC